MTNIKIFSKRFTSSLEIDALNASNSFALKLDILTKDPFELKIYGVCSPKISLWRTVSTCVFRSTVIEEKDQIQVRFSISGSFRFEMGQPQVCTPESSSLVVAIGTNPFLALGPTDLICLELSRSRAERDVSKLLRREFLFDNRCSNITLNYALISEFREFLVQTHCAVLKTELDVDIVYPLFEEMLISKFAMLIFAANESPPEIKLDRVTSLALEFIESNLHSKIGVAEIARAAGTNIRTLEKKFRLDLGLSPVAFLIDRRLEAVYYELVDPNCIGYISQVALKWGFSHMADFSKRFKQKYGKAPSQVRRGGTS